MTSPENSTKIGISVYPFDRNRKSDQDFHFVDVQPPLSAEEIDAILRQSSLWPEVFSQVEGEAAATRVMVEWTDDDFGYRDTHYDHNPETKAQHIAKKLGEIVAEIRGGDVTVVEEPVQVSGSNTHSLI